MPAHAVAALEREHGSLNGERVVVLGAAYRGGVKETAFSGVFPMVAALKRRGAIVTVHDPLFTDAELVSLGFTAHRLGSPVDAAIVHTDHADYAALTPIDLPEVRTIVDGRRVIDVLAFRTATVLPLGKG